MRRLPFKQFLVFRPSLGADGENGMEKNGRSSFAPFRYFFLKNPITIPFIILCSIESNGTFLPSYSSSSVHDHAALFSVPLSLDLSASAREITSAASKQRHRWGPVVRAGFRRPPAKRRRAATR